MELVLLFDHRFHRSPDRTIYSPLQYGYTFLQKRYLRVFDNISVIARVADVSAGEVAGRQPTEGPGIKVLDLGDWTGMWGFIKARQATVREMRRCMNRGAAVIMIAPGGLASIAYRYLVRRNYPFGLEVVSDPYAVFAPGAVEHPLRPFIRWLVTRDLRDQCRRAVGVLYVTKKTLQRLYPARWMDVSASDVELPEEAVVGGVAWTHCSSIELGGEGIAERRGRRKLHAPFRVVTVGSLTQRYKGTDVLIEAVARCVRAGLDLTAVVVGDGKYRPALIAKAERFGMGSRIRFVGQVAPGEPVRRILDESDLFVLPSRTEGLPRALIEAMARGLPCIGSAVGGIPELLDAGDLVPADAPAALAAKIQEVLRDPLRMEEMSQRNLRGAQEFRSSDGDERRKRLYEHVRDSTLRGDA
ncbi:MAG: glycosyltransferase [Candidatus Korobacteraceae bacterium]|jgi:glycosyltransferase involved in cell wall biosynthesis